MSAKGSTRSRNGSDTTVRSHWSRPSTKHKPTMKHSEDDDMAGRPEKEEKHRSRSEMPERERRKRKTSDAKKPQQVRIKSRSSKASSERSRRSEHSKTSSRSAGTRSSRSRDEDSVDRLGPVSSSTRSHNSSRRSSPHRRRSSPAILELEVTPDDSISQVGASSKASRPSARRRSTHAKLGRIVEDEEEEGSYEGRPPGPVKRHSIFDTLFGRHRKVYDDSRHDYDRRDRSPQESRRRSALLEEYDARRSHNHTEEDLARRLRLADLKELDDDPYARKGADIETWGLGNSAGHFMNDDFVQLKSKIAMSSFGDAKMGRRGERASGRRRQPKMSTDKGDSGLAPNFLGDQSVIGLGPFAPRTSRYPC